MATIPMGVVEITLEKEIIKIVSGKVRVKMSAVASGEFPAIPEFKGETDLVFNTNEMLSAINRVSVSASKDDSRPVFTGILCQFESNRVKLVATDGYRLGMDSLKIENRHGRELKKLIIPARSLQELMRVVEKDGSEKIEVKVEDEKQQVLFRVGEVELVSRLLAGEFPPYNQILPSSFKTKVSVNKDELIEAVKRAAIFARESANIVKIQITKDNCEIMSNHGQTGSSETEVEVKTEGEDLVVAFNSRYLLDALAAIEGSEIEFTSEGSLKPGVFVELSKKNDFLQVVMPVRVQE
jgi:DNA polymerase-3 subunit beta